LEIEEFDAVCEDSAHESRQFSRGSGGQLSEAILYRTSNRKQFSPEEFISMAQHATDERTQNQPSHEAQVKGGEHSHQGSQHTSSEPADGRSHNQPSHEAQVKGGQHSHQGSENSSSEPADGRSHNQPSHEAQVKGGQHSHAGSNR
jgi:hypothetical protein